MRPSPTASSSASSWPPKGASRSSRTQPPSRGPSEQPRLRRLARRAPLGHRERFTLTRALALAPGAAQPGNAAAARATPKQRLDAFALGLVDVGAARVEVLVAREQVGPVRA